MFVCEKINPDNTCMNWVEVSIFGLPPISEQNLIDLLTVSVTLLVIAYSLRFVAGFFFRR